MYESLRGKSQEYFAYLVGGYENIGFTVNGVWLSIKESFYTMIENVLDYFGKKIQAMGDMVSYLPFMDDISQAIGQAGKSLQDYDAGLAQVNQQIDDNIKAQKDQIKQTRELADSLDIAAQARQNAALEGIQIAMRERQALLDSRDAALAYNSRLLALVSSGDKMQRALYKYVKGLKDLEAQLASGSITQAEYSQQQAKLLDQFKQYDKKLEDFVQKKAKEGKVTQDTTQAQKAYNEQLKEANAWLERIETPAEKYEQKLFQIHQWYQDLIIDTDQFNALLKAAKDDFDKATTSAEKHAEKIKQDIPQAYKNVATDIQSGWNDSFKDLFDDGKIDYENYFDGLLDKFTDVMAQMATQAITQPVIVPMVKAVGQAMGVNQGAIDSITTQMGGGSDISSLFTGGFDAFGTGGIGSLITPSLNSAFSGMGLGSFAMGSSIGGAPLTLASGAQIGTMTSTGMVGSGATLGGSGLMGALGTAMPYIGAALALASAFGLFDGKEADTELTGYIGAQDQSQWLQQIGRVPKAFGFQSDLGAVTLGIGHTGNEGQLSDEEAAQMAAQYQQGFEQLVALDNMIIDLFELSAVEIERVKNATEHGQIETDLHENLVSDLISERYNNIVNAIDDSSLNAVRELMGEAASGSVDSLAIQFQGVELFKELENSLSLSAEQIKGAIGHWTHTIDTNTEEGIQSFLTQMNAAGELIKRQFSNADFWSFMEDVYQLRHSGELDKSASEIKALGDSLFSVNNLLPSLNKNTLEYSYQGAEMAQNILDQAGGYQNLAQTSEFYYQNFFTQEEQHQALLDQAQLQVASFNEHFGQFGSLTGANKDSLRSYIEGLDLGVEAQREAFVAAIELAPAIFQLADTADKTALALSAASARLENNLKTLRYQIDTQAEQVDLETQWTQNIQSANDWVQSLVDAGTLTQDLADQYKITGTNLNGISQSILKLGDAIHANADVFGSEFVNIAGSFVDQWANDAARYSQLTGMPLVYQTSEHTNPRTSPEPTLGSPLQTSLQLSENTNPATIPSLGSPLLGPFTTLEHAPTVTEFVNELENVLTFPPADDVRTRIDDFLQTFNGPLDHSSLDTSVNNSDRNINRVEPVIDETFNLIHDFNQAIDEAVNAFNEIAQALDDSRTSLYANMLGIKRQGSGWDEWGYQQGMIDNLYGQLDQTSGLESVAVVNDLQSAIMLRYNAEIEAIQETQAANDDYYNEQLNQYDSLKSALKNLSDYTESFALSDLSPLTHKERLVEAQALYEKTINEAEMHNVEAINKLPGVVDAYLKEFQINYASGVEYTQAFESIQLRLGNLGLATPAGPSFSEFETRSLNFDTQIADIQEAALTELAGLGLILEEVEQQNTQALQESTADITQAYQASTNDMIAAGQANANAIVESIERMNQRIADLTQQVAEQRAVAEQAQADLLTIQREQLSAAEKTANHIDRAPNMAKLA